MAQRGPLGASKAVGSIEPAVSLGAPRAEGPSSVRVVLSIPGKAGTRRLLSPLVAYSMSVMLPPAASWTLELKARSV
eukprot:7732532-Pyramimonas_sp.AAC.1